MAHKESSDEDRSDHHIVDLDLEASQKKDSPPLVKRLFTPLLLSKKVPRIPSDEERASFPAYSTNVFSRAFMLWILPLYKIGYLRTITQQDLWLLGDDLKLETTYARFRSHLHRIIEDHKKKDPDAKTLPQSTIANAIFQTFKGPYILSIIFKNVSDALIAFVPLVTRHLITFVQNRNIDPSTHVGKGIGLAFGVTIMYMARALCEAQSNLISFHVGGHSRMLLTKLILEKTFISTAETKHKFPNGTLLSFLSTDISRIDMALALFPEFTAFLIPTIIAIVLLIVNLKVSALAAIAVYFLVMFMLVTPMQIMMKLRNNANVHTDKRVELIREVVQSMKVIKFYSWEDAYERIIKVTRAEEITFVLRIQLLMAVIFSVALSASPVISMVGILVYHALSDGKNPAVIFSSLTLFNVLNFKMITLSVALGECTDGYNASRRLTKYLEAPVEEDDALEKYFDIRSIEERKDIAIKVSNAEFQWEKFEDPPETDKDENPESKEKGGKKENEKEVSKRLLEYETILRDINFEIKKGEFVIITGAIGSGKSSLLSALSGLIHKKSGTVSISGSSLLCEATPWIQNTTIRENVLFGSPYDEAKYQAVVHACCLDQDIAQLPAGDATEIGERGVTLSGGQKARLSLARVIYADSEIVLLDDVLSAVDANVAKRITDELFLGLIKYKTRVLATHQLSLLKKTDRVIFVNGDGSIDVGTSDEVLSRNAKFRDLLEYNKSHGEEEGKLNDQPTGNTKGQPQDSEMARDTNVGTGPGPGALYHDEERAVNSIPLSTYIGYINSGRGMFGLSIIPLIFISIVLAIFCTIFSNVWLTYWLEDKFHLSQGTYIGLYIMFTFTSVLLYVFEFGLESYVIVQASKTLNLQAVARLLHAPMSFFDTTPIGRIVNRFSKDTNSLDNEIGDRLKSFVHLTALCIGALILAVIYVPWFAIVLPFAVFILVACANFYQATSREVKRLEAINRSFILNNFNEVITGGDTIKLFRSQGRFIDKNERFSDMLNEVYFVVIANQRWIALSLDCLGILMLFIISMLVVTGVFNVSPSAAGLLIYYMSDFATMVASILSSYVEIENDMNSVERLMHYATKLVQEPPYRTTDGKDKPAESWPEHGAIQFQNASLRYRDGLPLVLKKLSIEVKAGEKIGICGRTGAGKSSLMVALYRLSELVEGSVTIDGVDISNIGLHDLRSKLSIIPQDPVLFQGTIRRNLDPFHERTDDELWDALRRSHMIKCEDLEAVREEKDKEKYHKFHLDTQVLDNGSNFSLGERQLIALARALVRQCKILIMDEATSSVDYETDHLIQTTIATEFKACTILCIAHRLKTIIGYDKILVLEKGELAEFDNPLNLFEMGQDSLFYQMCQSSGITREEFSCEQVIN